MPVANRCGMLTAMVFALQEQRVGACLGAAGIGVLPQLAATLRHLALGGMIRPGPCVAALQAALPKLPNLQVSDGHLWT